MTRENWIPRRVWQDDDFAEIKRAKRKGPESVARKIATTIYPEVLKPFSRGFHNSGNMIEDRFARLILAQEPLQFVAFWGIGEKKEPDGKDRRLLEEHAAILSAIAEGYPQGAEATLILANLHGIFNGYEGFESYLEKVAEEAGQLGINSLYLSDLYQQWGLTIPDPHQPIASGFNIRPDGLDNFDGSIWNNRQEAQLSRSAARHSRRGVSPDNAAYWYLQMRRQEMDPLAESFSDAVLLVNGSKDMGTITLPINIPHLYMRLGPVWFHSERPDVVG